MEESGVLLNVEKVAKILDLKTVTVRKMIYQGKLPFVKIGKAVRVKMEDVNRIINKGYRHSLS